MSNNPFGNLEFPKLHKNEVKCIDKESIPQEKATWTREDDVKMARDTLKRLAKPFFADGKAALNIDVDKLTDDQCIDMVKQLSDSLRASRGVSMSMRANVSKDADGNTVLKPVQFSVFAVKPLPEHIRIRLEEVTRTQIPPDDPCIQAAIARNWLRQTNTFEDVDSMTDETILMKTTCCLTDFNSYSEVGMTIATVDESDKNGMELSKETVEEATKDWETRNKNLSIITDKEE